MLLLCLGITSMLQSPVIVPAVDWDQAEIRSALSDLGRFARKRVVVEPAVKGQVTLCLRFLDFATVLSNALRQVDATYRVQTDGSYLVFRRPEDRVPQWLANAVHEMYPDDPDNDFLPDPKLDKDDIRNVLGELFGRRSAFLLDPQVKGIVKRPDKPMPHTWLLPFYLDQLKATYFIEGGLYKIVPRNRKP